MYIGYLVLNAARIYLSDIIIFFQCTICGKKGITKKRRSLQSWKRKAQNFGRSLRGFTGTDGWLCDFRFRNEGELVRYFHNI